MTFMLILASLAGCSRVVSDTAMTERAPETTVTLTHVSFGKIRNEIVLSATTAYLDKSVIAAPIPAFIANTGVQPGSRVRKGETLYTLETKERHALYGGTEPSTNDAVPVKAGMDGIVTAVMQQKGSYVPEGTVLCTLAAPGSLVFLLNVPYEQQKYALPGRQCTLVLPDESRLTATIQTPLTSMNTLSQAQQIIARANAPFLPEGMTVKVLITTDKDPDKQEMLLPKDAVQSDETMTAHWIMKLADDSTAIKIPVRTGNSSIDSIEILSPVLSPSDRIVRTGSYALEDSSRIVIAK